MTTSWGAAALPPASTGVIEKFRRIVQPATAAAPVKRKKRRETSLCMMSSALKPSSKGERENLSAGLVELNLKGMVGNRAFLTHQLVQPVFSHHACSIDVRIDSMVFPEGLSVYRDTKMNWLPVGRRAEHEMQVAGVETVADFRARRQRLSNLLMIDPAPG